VSRLAAILSTIQQVVVDPTSNLTAAVLVLAIAVLIALIIVIGMLLWVTGGRRPAPRRASAREVERDADEYEYPELSAELRGCGVARRRTTTRRTTSGSRRALAGRTRRYGDRLGHRGARGSRRGYRHVA
jgi:hypothetical protein